MDSEPSGAIELPVSNHEDITGAQRQSRARQLLWTLASAEGDLCRIYDRFRAGALKGALIVNNTSLLDEFSSSYLPLINRQGRRCGDNLERRSLTAPPLPLNRACEFRIRRFGQFRLS